MMQSLLPIRCFEDFARILAPWKERETSRQLLFLSSDVSDSSSLEKTSTRHALLPHWKLLSFSSLASLDSKQMITTARHIMKLASVHFFEVLKSRFFMTQDRPSNMLLSSTGKKVTGEELTRLDALSRHVVERLVDLYRIHPQDVAEYDDSLTVDNLRAFTKRLQEEAESVPAFYLGNSKFHDEYAQLNVHENPVQCYADLLARLAKREEGPYLPLSSSTSLLPEESTFDIAQTLTMEFLSTEMSYRLAQLPSDKIVGRKMDLSITGKGVVTYCVEEVIDLWEQLIAYKLSPKSDESAPNILAFRGTQRLTHLPGFWGSMISIWHPKGPGGNVITTKKIFELEERIVSSNKRWIFTGHSMGAKIAVAFSLRGKVKGLVDSVHSFGSPGRDKVRSTQSVQGLQAAHIGNVHDPVFQLGGAREGHTYVITTANESGRPLTVFETIHQVVEAVVKNHSVPQLSANPVWILSSIPQGQLIARYSPLWGFCHRLLSQHLYGPLKMVVLVVKAVWPIFTSFKRWVTQGTRKVLQKFAPGLLLAITIPVSENQDTTNGKALLSLSEKVKI